MKTNRLLGLLYGMLFATPAFATPADSHHVVVDTTAYGDGWLSHDLLLRPGHPCHEQEVMLLVRGFTPTPCDSFLGVAQVPGQPITVRTLHRPLADCGPGFRYFFAVPVHLGQLAAGFHSVTIRRRQLLQYTNGTIDSVETDSTYSFTVVPECPPPPPVVHASDLPHVDRATTIPARPCPNLPVSVQLNGHFPDGCGQLEGSWVGDPRHVSFTLAPYPQVPGTGCPEYLKPWEATLPLGPLQMGYHFVVLDETVRGTNAFWPPIPDEQHRGLFQFFIGEPCDTVPNPPMSYIHSIQIGPGRGDICPTDSIRVEITGLFPGDCCALKRIELHPSPIAGPLPEPPVVRVVVDWDNPVLCLCDPVPVPWTDDVLLAPLPSRDYGLIVELLERGGGRDSTLTSTVVPFQVAPAESCAIRPDCLWAGWKHDGPYGSCDAYVSPEREGTVTFMVKPGVALSGLQGTLKSWESGLYINGIEPVGVAAGMRLTWVRESQGARFVLFAEDGAPIRAGELQEILRVRAVVMQVAGIPEEPPPPPLGPVFHLVALDLLGADINGNGVHECLPPPHVRLAPEVAVLCTEQPCDFNEDGLNDVRDIVRMMRCVQGGPCPPGVGTRFDCDGNSRFDLGDVFCCAVHMLRQPGCPTCPVDTVRVEPTVTVAFGEPRLTPTGLDVPLLVGGLNRVGAARLRLRFPSDRFTALLMGAGGLPYLQDVENDVLAMGFIGGLPVPVPATGAGPAFDYPGPLMVRLTLRPGQSFGGELQLVDGQFSGLDGVLLGVDLDVPGVPLEGGVGVSLTGPWPNPSWGQVTLRVMLDVPSRLEVAVHDIAGRRVATVFRGSKDAGLHELTWSGRSDEGSEATNGLYFLRVIANDQVWKRKLVLVRQPETRWAQPAR